MVTFSQLNKVLGATLVSCCLADLTRMCALKQVFFSTNPSVFPTTQAV